MAFAKSSPELAARFAALLGRYGDVEPRQMFGCPAGFVHGNLFVGLFEDDINVKVGPKRLEEFRARGGTDFSPMAGRAMGGYVVVPREVRDDDEKLAEWVEAGLEYVRTLPLKEPKPKAPRAPRRSSP